MELTFLVDDYQWGDSVHLDENRELEWLPEGMIIAAQLELKDFGTFFNVKPQDGKSLSRISEGALYEAIGEVASEAYTGNARGNSYQTESILDCGVPVRCFPWHGGNKQLEIGKRFGTVGMLFGIVADDRGAWFHRPVTGRILRVSKLGGRGWLYQLTIETQVDINDKVGNRLHWEPPRPTHNPADGS